MARRAIMYLVNVDREKVSIIKRIYSFSGFKPNALVCHLNKSINDLNI